MKLGFGAHVGAEKRKLAAEEEAQVQFRIETGCGTAGNKPAAGREAGKTVIPCGGPDVFEDHVDAALVGDAADFLADFLGLVIDEMVGAELLGFLKFFVAAGSGDDASAEEFGDLYGGRADPAARPEDQHVFTRLQFGAGDEHVPSCLKD